MNTVRRTIAAVTAGVMCLLGTSAAGIAPFVSVTASAEDKLTYDVLTFAVNSEGTITITGCDETAKEVEIPAEIYGMPVTKIGWNAFSNCIDLTSVTILEGITEIDTGAFRDCTMLEFVVIPDSVRRIGYSCFEGTKILESQTDLVKYVDKWAIGYNDYCGSGGEEGIGAEIVIKDGTVGIASYAFGYLNQSIGWWMMPEDDAYGPSSVMLPDSLKYIGDGAFSEAHLLEHIDLPENLETIGWGAFMHSALSSISIPENVTKISEQAFGNCKNLTEVVIPESVTVIDKQAFDGCISLTEIAIPESVTEIGGYAFKDCTGLTNIAIPKGMTTINEGVFYECANLTDVVIPESVTAIGSFAFHGCTNLTEIAIPESVTEIGSYAFKGCTGLTDIAVPQAMTAISEGVFYECANLVNIVIPESVTAIGDLAFYGCTNLNEIAIPKNVTTLGTALYECASLTNVLIPEGVTAIDDYALNKCTALTEVVIPDSVTAIGAWAFNNCESLTDIYYAGTEEDWNAIEIDENGNESLLTATIHFNTPITFIEPDSPFYGDVDENGKVDIMDVILLNRNLMIGAEVGAQGMVNADADCNGTVDTIDSLHILKYVVQLITVLPV